MINIDTNEQQSPNLNIDVGVGNPAPSPELSQLRADKYAFGTHEYTGKSSPDIENILNNGQEDAYRTETASRVHSKNVELAMNSAVPYAPPPPNKKSVLEDTYAINYLKTAWDSSFSPAVKDAMEKEPEETNKTFYYGRTLGAQREIALKALEDVYDKYQKQSYPSWGVDLAKGLIPGISEAEIRNALGADWTKLRGQTIRDKIREFYGLSTDQFAETVPPLISKMSEHNPMLATQLAASIVDYSGDAELNDNLYTLMDIAAVPGILRAGRMAANVMKNTVRSVNSSMAGTAEMPINVAASTGAGDLKQAAIQRVTLDAKLNPNTNTWEVPQSSQAARSAIDGLMSHMRGDREKLWENPGNYGNQLTNRLIESSKRVETNLAQIVQNVARVERLPNILAEPRAAAALEELVRNDYPRLGNAILDIDHVYNPAITYIEQVINIGSHHGEYFRSYNVAKSAIDAYKIKGATVEAKNNGAGMGYYIQIRRPLDETRPEVRDNLILTDMNEPLTFTNAVKGKYRTPSDPSRMRFSSASAFLSPKGIPLRTGEETLSLDDRMMRKIASYAPGKYQQFAQDSLIEVTKLRNQALLSLGGRKQYEDWERMVKLAKDTLDPETGEKGYFYKNVGEVEYAWMRTLNRLPVPAEVEAYFAHTRFVEVDRFFRSMNLTKLKLRLGGQQHSFDVIDPKSERGKERVNSGFFEAVKRNTLPHDTENAMYIAGAQKGDEKVFYPGRVSMAAYFKKIEASVKAGDHTVLELLDPEHRPLSNFSKKAEGMRIRYVVVPTKQLTTKALEWDTLPRRGGGHFDYDYPVSLKQAIITPQHFGNRLIEGKRVPQFQHIYEGDSHVSFGESRAQLQVVADHWNKMLPHIQKDDWAAAEAHFNQLPFAGLDFPEFKSWFSPSYNPKGEKVPARLNKTEEFRVVPEGSLIGHMDNSLRDKYSKTYFDGTTRGSLMRQHQVEYTKPRDAWEVYSMKDKGTHGRPLFEYQPAKLVDPIPSINRAMMRIINSTYGDDYKIMAMEHWLEQARHWMRADIKEIRSSPFWYFSQAASPDFFLPKTPPEIKRQLMANHSRIRTFTGIHDEHDAFLHSMAQKWADEIYKVAGPKGALAPTWLLPHITDPIWFTRSVVFNLKMGFYNIAQFAVHAWTYSNVYGFAGPVKATQGMVGAALHGLTSMNKHFNIMQHFDTMATRFEGSGWKPGEWIEARNLLDSTGFLIEHGEHALKDEGFTPKVMQSLSGKFLDLGQMFFRGGVRMLRTGAWYTAFREFKDIHPTGKVDMAGRRWILERADLLAHNMSRASSSAMNQGFMSIQGQFTTYFLRLSELMTGKRLSFREKAQLFTANAFFFGLPTTIGLFGLPLERYLRDTARDHGYIVGDGFISSLIMEGIPAAIGAIVSGGGNPRKGTWWNFGPRYGPEGYATLGAIYDSKPFWQILGGASASTLANVSTSSGSFVRGMQAIIQGKPDSYPLMWEDMVDILKEISSVKNGYEALVAFNTGRWFTKNEQYMSNTTTAGTVWRFLTGLSDSRESDLYHLGLSAKAQKALEGEAENFFIKEQERYIMAITNGDKAAQDKHHARMAAILIGSGYPPEKVSELIIRANKSNRPLLERMEESYYIGRDVPVQEREKRQEMFKRIRQLQSEKDKP